MAAPKLYDPTKVKVFLAGIPVRDYGEDTFISLSRMADLRTPTVGADGNVTINRSANMTGTLELTIMSNSATNNVLNILATRDEGFPLAIVDANFAGDLGAATSYAFVANIPDFERGAEIGENVWPILLVDANVAFDALKNVADIIP